MTYEQIIQQAGKSISPVVYYYDNGTRVNLDVDDFISAKISYNAKLVGTVMNAMELEIKPLLDDVPIYLEITATYDESSATKTYGPYYRSEKPTYNADKRTYTYNLYDNFVKSMVDYEPISITYPTTILAFFQQLCVELGYTTNISSLPNGLLPMENDIYEGINYTYRSVFEDIAQANGVLFKIDGNEIKLCELGTTAITIDDDILKNANIDFGEHYGPINTIALSRSGDSDAIYHPSPLPQSPIEFKIVDNQLMNGNDRDNYIQAIYNQLNGIEFDLFDTELVGYGGFEPLQKIIINTIDANGITKTYNSYVFNNEIKITQGYEETIYSERPKESETDYKVADTTDKRINQAYIIVNKQNLEINSVVKKNGLLEDDIKQLQNDTEQLGRDMTGLEQSILTQTSSAIEASISKVYEDLEGEPATLKNELITIDINGISVATNISEIQTLMANDRFTISDGSTDLFYVGYNPETNKTEARMDNLTVDHYFVAGNHRIENYEVSGEARTGFFYIG